MDSYIYENRCRVFVQHARGSPPTTSIESIVSRATRNTEYIYKLSLSEIEIDFDIRQRAKDKWSFVEFLNAPLTTADLSA